MLRVQVHPEDIAVYGWRHYAGCKDADPELMACDNGNVKGAKDVCAKCPVIDHCLREALEKQEVWGVWGGLTTSERAYVSRGGRVIDCGRCGRRRVAYRCDYCERNHPSLTSDTMKGRLQELAATRMSDADIARTLTEELGTMISARAVCSARSRWHIPSRARGAPNHVKHNRLDFGRVDVVLNTGDGFGDLSRLEQVELLKLWLRKSSKNQFMLRFHVSGRTIRELTKMLEATKSGRGILRFGQMVTGVGGKR